MRPGKRLLICAAACAALLTSFTAIADYELASGLEGTSGSTIGPDGALYVTERLAGRVSRIDPWTGDVTNFAEDLPVPVADIGVGGATDVVFIDGIAYVLVTVVGPAFDVLAPLFGQEPGFGGTDAVGIYRVDGPNSSTLIADLGAYSKANPPDTGYFLDHGVQYAIEAFRGGFLVSDGHHNRVLSVSLDGDISVFKAFGNIVPTGLEVQGKTVYMARAGEITHEPEEGRVLAIDAQSGAVTEVAAGAPLAVDVERGLGQTLYALGQGDWNGTFGADGSPADFDTGELLRINSDGTMTIVASGLNQPTSMQFIGNTAYIVLLGGSVWVVEDVGAPPFGRSGKSP